MKDPKEYLHLYLGCDMLFEKSGRRGKLVGLNATSVMLQLSETTHQWYDLSIWNFKPVLLPLSELTHELAQKMPNGSIHVTPHNVFYSPEGFTWLLKNGFDLFGLIEENLALDKTKLKDRGL